jgi:predicted ATP-grasp superfamily ATP-dependent carboligase
VARALGKEKVPLVIVEEKTRHDQPDLKTRFGKKYIIDSLIGKALLEFLNSCRFDAIIFPTTDRQVLWLSENRKSLPDRFKLLFPDTKTISLLLDKNKFFNFCSVNDILLPKFKYINVMQDIRTDIVGMIFPLIVKTPIKIYKPGLKKAYIVKGVSELLDLWKKLKLLHDKFLVQEFIPGGDDEVFFCLQYISSKGILLASFVGKKIRQWRPLCGGTASCEPADVPELHWMTEKIFKLSGFCGIGSIEYKRDFRNGKFYVVEPTVCRTDFQEQVAIVNNVNIPFIAYCDALGLPIEPAIAMDGRNSRKAWMHFTNDRLSAGYYIKKKELTRIQWLYSLRNVRSFDLFSLRDPMPGLLSALRWVNRQCKKISRNSR